MLVETRSTANKRSGTKGTEDSVFQPTLSQEAPLAVFGVEEGDDEWHDLI